MPQNLKQLWENTRALFSRLSVGKRILVTAGLLLVTVGAVIGAMLYNQSDYQTLYSDLGTEDTQAIIKKLSVLGVDYRMSEDKKSILVPSAQVDYARMELAKDGLPGNDVVGFEKFDGATFGMSSYVQRIQYVRAIQGELTRSIQRIQAVRRARVHISHPPKKTFLDDQEPAKASVILELKPGMQLSRTEVRGIAHLVASAVEGLKVDQVSILDAAGNFLHQPDDQMGSASMAMIEHQRMIENAYEKRVVELLTPVVGTGRVVAKVTTELDLSRVNTMEEKYDADNAVLKRSVRNNEVSSGSRPNPMGVPGSRANLPGAEANQVPAAASSSTERDSQDNSFAIPKVVQTIDKPIGGIKRLTVAVIVDGQYQNDAGENVDPGKGKFVPRTQEELNRLQDIVANAVGLDPSRRDRITITSLPIANSLPVLPEEETSWFRREDIIKPLLKHGVAALLILLFVFAVLRPFLRWAAMQPIQKEIAVMPKTVAELEAAQNQDEQILALSKAVVAVDEGESLEKQENQELLKRIVEKLDHAPRKSSRIVQEWMEESNTTVKAITA